MNIRIKKKKLLVPFNEVFKKYRYRLNRGDCRYLKSLSYYYKNSFATIVREMELIDFHRRNKKAFNGSNIQRIAMDAFVVISCIYENSRNDETIPLRPFELIAFSLVFKDCQIQDLVDEIFD